nr:hypothetical protein [Dictyobacter aurantiacus]
MTIKHIRPLRLFVPVQLTDSTGIQAHVDARQRSGDRQFAPGDLARPATLLQPIMSSQVLCGLVHRGRGCAPDAPTHKTSATAQRTRDWGPSRSPRMTGVNHSL